MTVRGHTHRRVGVKWRATALQYKASILPCVLWLLLLLEDYAARVDAAHPAAVAATVLPQFSSTALPDQIVILTYPYGGNYSRQAVASAAGAVKPSRLTTTTDFQTAAVETSDSEKEKKQSTGENTNGNERYRSFHAAAVSTDDDDDDDDDDSGRVSGSQADQSNRQRSPQQAGSSAVNVRDHYANRDVLRDDAVHKERSVKYLQMEVTAPLNEATAHETIGPIDSGNSSTTATNLSDHLVDKRSSPVFVSVTDAADATELLKPKASLPPPSSQTDITVTDPTTLNISMLSVSHEISIVSSDTESVKRETVLTSTSATAVSKQSETTNESDVASYEEQANAFLPTTPFQSTESSLQNRWTVAEPTVTPSLLKTLTNTHTAATVSLTVAVQQRELLTVPSARSSPPALGVGIISSSQPSSSTTTSSTMTSDKASLSVLAFSSPSSSSSSSSFSPSTPTPPLGIDVRLDTAKQGDSLLLNGRNFTIVNVTELNDNNSLLPIDNRAKEILLLSTAFATMLLCTCFLIFMLWFCCIALFKDRKLQASSKHLLRSMRETESNLSRVGIGASTNANVSRGDTQPSSLSVNRCSGADTTLRVRDADTPNDDNDDDDKSGKKNSKGNATNEPEISITPLRTGGKKKSVAPRPPNKAAATAAAAAAAEVSPDKLTSSSRAEMSPQPLDTSRSRTRTLADETLGVGFVGFGESGKTSVLTTSTAIPTSNCQQQSIEMRHLNESSSSPSSTIAYQPYDILETHNQTRRYHNYNNNNNNNSSSNGVASVTGARCCTECEQLKRSKKQQLKEALRRELTQTVQAASGSANQKRHAAAYQRINEAFVGDYEYFNNESSAVGVVTDNNNHNNQNNNNNGFVVELQVQPASCREGEIIQDSSTTTTRCKRPANQYAPASGPRYTVGGLPPAPPPSTGGAQRAKGSETRNANEYAAYDYIETRRRVLPASSRSTSYLDATTFPVNQQKQLHASSHSSSMRPQGGSSSLSRPVYFARATGGPPVEQQTLSTSSRGGLTRSGQLANEPQLSRAQIERQFYDYTLECRRRLDELFLDSPSTTPQSQTSDEANCGERPSRRTQWSSRTVAVLPATANSYSQNFKVLQAASAAAQAATTTVAALRQPGNSHQVPVYTSTTTKKTSTSEQVWRI